jgi:hypothetical protein
MEHKFPQSFAQQYDTLLKFLQASTHDSPATDPPLIENAN